MKALITGASSGIGRDIARELSKKGYELILVARDIEKLNELKNELKTSSEVVSMDVSKSENCKELHDRYYDIDILVNNAGFGDCGYFDKTDLEKELQMINTNIVGYHVLTKLYLQDMKKKNRGKIKRTLKQILRMSIDNSFVVKRNGEVLVRVPVLIPIVCAAASFWITAIVLFAGLIFGLKYSFEGKELGKDTINDTMEKASDFAQNIVDEIKE